jgi:pimeloyl-ACP methyl ester carboxylesterase
MIWRKLAFSFIVLLGLILALIWQLSDRRHRFETRFPPMGQFITVAERQVHYRQTGSGPDVILLHGASGNLREWEFGLRTVLEGRFRVTAFDRPGHGYSDLIANNDHLDATAAHLRAAAAELGIRDYILVGHSYGGSVALAWSLQVQPKALVLISAPSLPWPGALDPWYRATDTALGAGVLIPLAAAIVPQSYVNRAVRGVFAPASAPDAYMADMGAALTLRAKTLRANTAQVNHLLADIRGQMARYDRLKMPMELIHGDQDTIVPLAIHAAPFAAKYPHAHLTVIAGAGHMPHHSHLPQVVAAIDRAASRP